MPEIGLPDSEGGEAGSAGFLYTWSSGRQAPNVLLVLVR